MEKRYEFFQNLVQEIPEIPGDSIISRTLYADDQLKVVLFGFAAGQELSEHTASMPAMLYFIKGEADLSLGGDQFKVQEGSLVHMTANLSHSIHARTPTTMLLMLLRKIQTSPSQGQENRPQE